MEVDSLFTSFGVVVFGLDFYDFLELRLVEIFSRVLQYIFGLFLKDFEEKDRDHVLKFWMFSKVGLIINSVLDFFLIENTGLGLCKSFDANNVMLVVVFFAIVHVVDVVVVEFFLLLLFGGLLVHFPSGRKVSNIQKKK